MSCKVFITNKLQNVYNSLEKPTVHVIHLINVILCSHIIVTCLSHHVWYPEVIPVIFNDIAMLLAEYELTVVVLHTLGIFNKIIK